MRYAREMLDEPPQSVQAAEPIAAAQEQRRADGTIVIDLLPLAPAPQVCEESAPDPLQPEIVVCRAMAPSPRLGTQLPDTTALMFGSAVPRARLELSESAEAQANATNPSVGGWNAQGAEAKIKLEF